MKAYSKLQIIKSISIGLLFILLGSTHSMDQGYTILRIVSLIMIITFGTFLLMTIFNLKNIGDLPLKTSKDNKEKSMLFFIFWSFAMMIITKQESYYAVKISAFIIGLTYFIIYLFITIKSRSVRE